MIIKPPTRFKHNDENMLPMINIVFLLLIFFMIAGVLQARDALHVTPVTTSKQGGSHVDNNRLLVSANGQLGMRGKRFAIDDIPTVLPAIVSTTTSLQLKADAQLDAATLKRLLTALNSVGIKHVRLLAEQAP